MECKQCGQCCHFTAYGEVKRCPYLVDDEQKPGKTYCRIYENRVGVIIGKTERGLVYCGFRKVIKKNFKGCPFNKPEYETQGGKTNGNNTS